MAFRLIPRDESFFPPFDRLAAGAVDAAKSLHALLLNIPVSDATVVALVDADATPTKFPVKSWPNSNVQSSRPSMLKTSTS
jgi:hypothetical protein